MTALRIMIVEDEAVIARRVARLTSEILGPQAGEIVLVSGVADARRMIDEAVFDLLLLDLNLDGEDGFELLRDAATRSFDTIVISAHTTRALEAFEYGVRDFIPKPFSRDRLSRALGRVLASAPRSERSAEYLGVRANGGVEFVPLNCILYIRGAGPRSELVLNGVDAGVCIEKETASDEHHPSFLRRSTSPCVGRSKSSGRPENELT